MHAGSGHVDYMSIWGMRWAAGRNWSSAVNFDGSAWACLAGRLAGQSASLLHEWVGGWEGV